MIDRYSRQTLFRGIGEEGQKKLSNSNVVIVGCGVLGAVIANTLVRAGVGRVKIIDRDLIEYHNLQTSRWLENSMSNISKTSRRPLFIRSR